jgi:hypothetical protein
MVDPTPRRLEWENDDPRISRSHIRNRRQRFRLGIRHSRPTVKYRRSKSRHMVNHRKSFVHQLARAQSRLTRGGRQGTFLVQENSTSQERQHNYMRDDQPARQPQTPSSTSSGATYPLSMRHESHSFICNISPGQGECGSRSAESFDATSTARTMIVSPTLSPDREDIWETLSGSACDTAECPSTDLLLPQSREDRLENGCLLSRLATGSICVSALEADKSHFSEGSQGAHNRPGAGDPVVDHSTVVERARSTERPSPQPSTFNGLAHIDLAGLDADTVQIMGMAKKSRTIASYRTHMKHYSNWCKSHHIDPSTAMWQQRLQCLTD